jgi:hypothetical protein
MRRAVQVMVGASRSDVGRHHDDEPGPSVPTSAIRVSNRRRSVGHDRSMCRNIRVLHNFEPPATEDEVHEAALQYVRKISGAAKPSKANEEAFARAVAEITASTRELLEELVTTAPPKDREIEANKARERSRERYAR